MSILVFRRHPDSGDLQYRSRAPGRLPALQEKTPANPHPPCPTALARSEVDKPGLNLNPHEKKPYSLDATPSILPPRTESLHPALCTLNQPLEPQDLSPANSEYLFRLEPPFSSLEDPCKDPRDPRLGDPARILMAAAAAPKQPRQRGLRPSAPLAPAR